MPPGNYSGIGGRLAPASANLNTNLQPIVDGTQAGPPRRPYTPKIQKPVIPTVKPGVGIPPAMPLLGIAGQVSWQAPLIYGALKGTQHLLATERGKAFKQNMQSGNYGQAMRHLTGQYGDTSQGLRFEVDPGALNRRLTSEQKTEKKSGRLDDPIAGKGPKSNQVGSEVDQSTWKKQSTQEEELLAPGEKRNANGIIQKGKDLSSSNLGRQMLLELPELDANRFIQSDGPTPAPGAGLNVNMPGVSADTATVPAKMPDEAGPSEAIEPSPEKGKASGINWMKSRQPASVSDVRANAMYSTIGEGPMAFIRQRNSALGINAAGNIAKIDGQDYNINPEQYKAMLDGAGMTREGLDAIKNTATPFVAPGSPVSDVSSRFDTSNLNPAGVAAVEATAQPIMGVQDLVPTNPNFSTKGMTDENAEEFMKRFRAALQASA